MSTARSAFVPHDLKAPVAGAAAGSLAGLTVAVKDLYDIAGYRTGGGSPEWLAAHPAPKSTAPAVRKLLDAGATIIGKTICDELFFSVTGISRADHHPCGQVPATHGLRGSLICRRRRSDLVWAEPG